MTLRKIVKMAILAIVWAAAGNSLWAQSAVDGAIGGTLEDATGSAISGATIVIRSNGTNAEQTVVCIFCGRQTPTPENRLAVSLIRCHRCGKEAPY